MAENKMKEVAKLLGVEMGVPFKVKNGRGNILTYSPYYIIYLGGEANDKIFRS